MAPGANILLVEATSSASLTNLSLDAVNESTERGGRIGGFDELGRERVLQLQRDRVYGPDAIRPLFHDADRSPGRNLRRRGGRQWGILRRAVAGEFSQCAVRPEAPVSTRRIKAEPTTPNHHGAAPAAAVSSQVEVEPFITRRPCRIRESGLSRTWRTTPTPIRALPFYDSVSDQGYVGWQEVGPGTSGGAPQWAAIIAIANQARVLAGKATLDGVSQTLPALYDLYSAPGSSDYSTYTSYFNDVVDSAGGGGRYHWQLRRLRI